MTEHDDIVSALSHIPAHDRDTWVCMGMAVKHELGEAGFPTWDQWSQSADNYQAKAAKAVWKSIKAGGKVTIASLFAEAIKAGWQPSKPYTPPTTEQRAQLAAERAEAERLAAELLTRQREAAKVKAAKLWEAGHDVAADHPYLLAKGLTQPEGMKQLRDMLLLPISIKGELVNLQIICADGSKRFLTGGQVKGGSLLLGKLQGAAEAILCEGWATGCSLREATGKPVVVAFTAGNLPEIAEKMSEALPELALIVVGDADESGTGQRAAQKAALLHGKARWCIPAFSDAQRDQHQQKAGKLPSDFNDLHQVAGLDEVRQQINSAEFFEAPKKPGNTGNTGNKTEESNIHAGLEGTGNNAETGNTRVTPGNKARTAPFFVARTGVYWLDPDSDDAQPAWICSPLWVLAETRDVSQSNWGRLLRWFDNDGHEHTWACPSSLLVSTDTAEVRKILADQGLVIATSPNARKKLIDYILTHKPVQAERARCVTRIGWHGDRYILPGKTYGQTEGESVIYQGTDSGCFSQSGMLDDWQREVAARAAGNSRLVFFISASFAGSLLDMAGDYSGGFHLCGKTSGGKSTTLEAAASVWGKPTGERGFKKLWRATSNGLELLCSSRNHNALILDELKQVDPREAGNAAYTISNGSAKERMNRDATARPTATWSTILLSAGELDLAQHMQEAGKTAHGGQHVRLPSIPADAGAGLGVFENIHDCDSPKAFADRIKDASSRYYGTAGDAFLAALSDPDNLKQVRDSIQGNLEAISKTFNMPATAAQEVGRVATRFALAAYAGELATRYRVTGWKPKEAIHAAQRCFSEWLAEHGGEIGADDRAMFAQVRGFIEAHGSSRFPPHNADPENLQRYSNRAGFSRLDERGLSYMVLPQAFKSEVCGGFNTKTAIKALVSVQWLEPGTGGKDSQPVRIKALDNKLTRVYVLTPAVLEGEQ